MIRYINKKRILIIITAIIVLITMSSYAYGEEKEGKCGDNLTYNFTYKIANSILTIDGTGDMYDYSESNLPPWAYDECPTFEEIDINEGITSIGNYAFYDITGFSELVIPDGVKEIGDKAFTHSGIDSIKIPNSVEYISPNAFDHMGKDCFLKVNEDSYAHEWAVNNGVMYVINGENHYEGQCGENATFKYNEDTKTLIISGTGDMQDYSRNNLPPWFSYIKEANRIEIEKGITNIGFYAFYNSSSLNDIVIPEGVTSIGDYSFVDVGTLNYTIPNSVEYISPYAFSSKGTGEICCNFTFKVYRDSYAHNWALKNTLGYSIVEEEYTAGKCGINALFEYDEKNKTLIISGTGDMFDYSYENQAPWRGYASEIEEVNIEEGITYIGDNTFNMFFKYGNIAIPNSVIGIAEDALSLGLTLNVYENSYANNWASELDELYTELNESGIYYYEGEEIWSDPYNINIKEPNVIEKLDMDTKILIVISCMFFLLFIWALVRHNKKKKVKLTESNNSEEGEKW